MTASLAPARPASHRAREPCHSASGGTPKRVMAGWRAWSGVRGPAGSP